MELISSKMSDGGRVVVPAKVRKRLGVGVGEVVLFELDDDGETIRLSSRKQAVRRAQEMFRKRVPAGVSLVDELIADRRREAANE
jgi:AbrB family looped-hinge helix DNA binding protein